MHSGKVATLIFKGGHFWSRRNAVSQLSLKIFKGTTLCNIVLKNLYGVVTAKTVSQGFLQ